MNCKPGDLAIIVAPLHSQNAGVIVEVIRPAFPGDLMEGGGAKFQPDRPGPYWLVRTAGRPLLVGGKSRKRRTTWTREVTESPIADSRLRPIRDNDGTDETLTWAGKPEGVTA